MHYVGIDLHKNTAYWTVKDEEGEIKEQRELPVDRGVTKDKARELSSECEMKAVVEPTCAYRKYKKWLESEDVETKIVHPLKIKAIAYSKLKHDKADSETLAELLRLGFVPEVSCVSDEKHEMRKLVSVRKSLVRKKAKLKQKLREILRENNTDIKASNIFGRKAQKEIEELSFSSGQKRAVKSLIKAGKEISREVEKLESFLKERYGNEKEIEILTSIPGMGLITACTVSSIVGDWSRFSSGSKLASFAGLVPSSHDSGQTERKGRITKQGSKPLRSAMYRAAVAVTENAGYLYDFYQRIKSRRGAKKARVALARKMLTVAWHLMKKEERFDSGYLQNQKQA